SGKASSIGAMKSKIQSIASPGPAMNPSSDIDLFTTTLPSPVLVSRTIFLRRTFAGCHSGRNDDVTRARISSASRRHASRSRLSPARAGDFPASLSRVIIWINGAFGAGKTALAEELHRRLPDAVRYNPEDVGLMLWKQLRPNGDFQHLPSWRELVVVTALSLRRHHADTLIVPMSLIRDAYRA